MVLAEAIFYFGLSFAPFVFYLLAMLLWSLPERICPRNYPVKSVCTSACLKCPKNIELLTRAKTFVDEAVILSHPKITDALATSLKASERQCVFRIPELASRSLWNHNHFGSQMASDIKILEDNFATIKLACLRTLKNASMWQRKSDINDVTYFIYPMLIQGNWYEDHCNLEPDLMNVIHSLKSSLHGCLFGNIYFSLIPPKTKIQLFPGLTNIMLKCQLALEIPKDEDSCFLTVGEERISWEEGKCFVFDETLPISMASKVPRDDIILLNVDLWHPSLNSSEKNLIRRAFPHGE